jgi:hypothetical protein
MAVWRKSIDATYYPTDTTPEIVSGLKTSVELKDRDRKSVCVEAEVDVKWWC